MGIDLNKSLKVATIPIAVLVALGIVGNLIFLVVGYVPFLGFAVACLTGIGLLVLRLLVLGWAGFKSVKEAQMDLAGGAVTGAIAGVIGGVINAIIGFVFVLLGIGANVAGGSGAAGAAIGAAFGVIGLVVAIIGAIIFGAIVGAIMGAIGAFVAGMKK